MTHSPSAISAETDFVSEDTTTFAKAPQSKDYRVDLVRIRIDARLPLRRGVALQIVWSTDTDEILSQNPSIESVDFHACSGIEPLIGSTRALRRSGFWRARSARLISLLSR